MPDINKEHYTLQVSILNLTLKIKPNRTVSEQI